MSITIKTGDIEPTINQYFEEKTSLESIKNKFSDDEIIQDTGTSDDSCFVSTMNNGLVGTIFDAYCDHHNLILRPDDFWLAILTQFSLYINANSEKLRDKFVEFDDKRDLTITYASGSLHNFDYSIFINDMEKVITDNIKDKEFSDWMVPCFSTTSDIDRVVGRIILMSSLKNYFDYGCNLMCGIPEVTLLGEMHDWILLRNKVDRLLNYDIDGVMQDWHSLLVPILDDLILCTSGKEPIIEDFWQKSCNHLSFGSGPRYLSGWITIFNVFSKDGVYRGNNKKAKTGWTDEEYEFPVIDTNRITGNIVTVPITVKDFAGEHKTTMNAGSFLTEIKDDGYTVQPRTDFVLTKDLQMKYVKLKAKPNTWFEEGSEVYDYDEFGKRLTIDEYKEWKKSGGILVRGIRICENKSELQPLGHGYIDNDLCGINDFDVSYTDSQYLNEK